MNMQYDIYLALPRGFCAGVERAIQTVENCLKKYGKPVYVLHEIVHNKHVISELQAGGAIFVEHLAQIPKGGIAIFSAHGVSKDVEKYADELGLRTVNATCPLVTRVHRMVEKYHEEGCETLIIGHHNHPEVEGTAGRVENRVQIVSETGCRLFQQLKKPKRLLSAILTRLALLPRPHWLKRILKVLLLP